MSTESRRVLIVGVGAGDPDYITVQAINALNESDVVFLLDKGVAKQKLISMRKAICDRYLRDPARCRIVEVADVARDQTFEQYAIAVDAWREARAELYESLLLDALPPGEIGAFLVWGDPTLFDGTIDSLERVLRRGRVDFTIEVIPGISTVSALAARHRQSLTGIGGAVRIVSGRNFARRTAPLDRDETAVVMLVGDEHLTVPATQGTDLLWGAYVGMDIEVTIAGEAADVAPEIIRRRRRCRRELGWILDAFIVRPNDGDPSPDTPPAQPFCPPGSEVR